MLAVWVQKSAADTTAEAEVLVARLAAGGVTDLFYYPGLSSYDSLANLTTIAHRAGLRVHAWLCFGADLYSLDSAWKCSGVAFTNFGIAAARAKMGEIVSAILKAIPDVDGFHLDYMRAPVIDSTAYYTAADVTAAVEIIADSAGGKTLSAAVKAYEDDPSRWAQAWPEWIADNLIDFVCPMCYDAGMDVAYHSEYWLSTGVPLYQIAPGLAIIDTADSNEPLKDTATLAAEVGLFVDLGLEEDFALFDDRVTAAQLAAVVAELPDEGGNEMGIYDTLIAQADALAAVGNDLIERAEVIRTQALALQGADTAADTAVIEAQEALDAAQALADTF